MSAAPFTFGIVIPSRNRPEMVQRAVASVLRQTCRDFRIAVVDDGSDASHRLRYDDLEGLLGAWGSIVRLAPRMHGHGPSYSRNVGVAATDCDYVCFLDDDDEWTDPGHLARVLLSLQRRRDEERPVDLYFSDQIAFADGIQVDRAIWIEDLKYRLPPTQKSDGAGAFTVTLPQLLQCRGFCHLNTTVVRRDFFLAIGGFDEGIRYESDRDFYLRAIDVAHLIKYCPVTVSRHNVPNREERVNASTLVPVLERRLFQLRLLDKAIMYAQHNGMREYGMLHKSYTLKLIVEELVRNGRYDLAMFYALEVLSVGFNVSWLGFCGLIYLKKITSKAVVAD